MKIKIHQALLEKIATEKQLLKIISTWLVLKKVHHSSIIINLSSRRAELATTCFIGKRTFDARITQLLKMGLVTIIDDNLHLISYENLYKSLDLDTTRERYYTKKVTVNPEYVIRATIAENNLNKQKILIAKKIIDNTKITGGSLPNVEDIRLKEHDRFICCLEYRMKYENYFNPDVTLSTQEFAALFALCHQNSGCYWQKTLQKKGLIKTEQRMVQVQKKSHRKKGKQIPGGYIYCDKSTGKDLIQLRNQITIL